jgi:hypothetical protein
VTFLAALVDTDWVPVIITYADGATDRLGVQNMIEMGGPSVWRMTIGTDVNPGGPAPAVLGVKVSGVFVMVGGPAPGVRLPLPGRIVATNTAGRGFTGIVGKSGRFTIWLPPGTYHLTGHSPRAHAGGHEMRCAAAHPVRAQAGGSPTPRVEVACSVPWGSAACRCAPPGTTARSPAASASRGSPGACRRLTRLPRANGAR